MTDPVRDGRANSRWLWAIVLIIIAVAVTYWLASPLGEQAKVEPTKPQAQSTEWAPTPEGPAVPVTLPTTKLKVVPIDDKNEAREREPAKETD